MQHCLSLDHERLGRTLRAVVRSLCVRKARGAAILLLGLAIGTPAGATEQPTAIPMMSSAWTLASPAGWIPAQQGGKTEFARYEGMANGTMTIRDEAIMVSRDARFANGTIDFDVKPLAYNDTGIVFRRQNNDGGEFLYLRANPDCPAASDCIQYVPITHGLMSWNIYSAEQGPAPITATGWNHIRLVVAGSRMEVFVNHLSEPTLVVALRAATNDGGIAFKGPAVYANLVIRPAGAEARAAIDDPAPAPGMIRTWLAAPPVALPSGRAPVAADIPSDDDWKPIDAAPDGLVDLGRSFGIARAPAISTGWLRFTLNAEKPDRQLLQLGWANELAVFLNGKRIYAGENFYHPPEGRLSPDGRLEPDNATIPLELQPGENRIVLAVGNRWHSSEGVGKASPFGWGAEARLLKKASGSAPGPRWDLKPQTPNF